MAVGTTLLISLDDLFLDLKNPRFEPVKDESAAIRHLVEDEFVIALAKDIAESGLNPLERFAVLKEDTNFIVLEGNRRVCALKLLRDPDLAPDSKTRSAIEKLGSDVPEALECEVFEHREDATIWLHRLHGGQDEGRGRRSWSAEQKARFEGDASRNWLAEAVLTYARQRGIPVSDSFPITTLTRALSNPVFRNVGKLSKDGTTQLPTEVFDHWLSKVVGDVGSDLPLAERPLNSRQRSRDFQEYARAIESEYQCNFVDEWPLLETNDPESTQAPDVEDEAGPGKESDKNDSTGKDQKSITKLAYNAELHQLIETADWLKLHDLYSSIMTVSAAKHTTLVAVGIWSFLETFTAKFGRDENTSFDSFAKSRFKTLELRDKSLGQALTRLNNLGNSSKHHGIHTATNAKELHINFKCVESYLKKELEALADSENK